MTQKSFLTLVSLVALAVGTLALAAPAALLASKGVLPLAATQIWVRETGLLILMTGIVTLLVRADPDSPTLRSLLFANAALQGCLLPIELYAHSQGTIPPLSGVLPNSIFHLLAGSGFLYFALRMKTRLAVSRPG
jgi:hypothetical protein